mgnify:CR=1 FL=1|tara:strand:- start:43 stop:438 length:396 start_codon:yes stop_codon:yes gene_type:complete
MYAKLNVSGAVEAYPYSLAELRSANPNTSFVPSALSNQDVRTEYSVVEVQEVEQPVESGKNAVLGDPVKDGSVWKQSWSLVDQSAADKEASVISARRAEYGTVEEQIEFITENSLKDWKDKVDDIKSRHPK